MPEDCAVFFVMATYGEGEPTDNAVTLMQNLTEDSFEFSNGEHKLEGLKYVIFGLGNRTYEHYNEIARKVDQDLTKAGAIRIGERGEGDDDKSMEEDYLEWKDGMWAADIARHKFQFLEAVLSVDSAATALVSDRFLVNSVLSSCIRGFIRLIMLMNFTLTACVLEPSSCKSSFLDLT